MPLGYRRHVALRRPKLDAPTGFIDQILHNDVGVPKKQRHTIQRVYDRLREERGFDGGYTTVRDYGHPRPLRLTEALVPLAHPAGHAQADFGAAWAEISGVSVPSRIRIVNLSDTYGVVEIVGFDDQGEEYGPVELELEAHASVVLLTRELENGAPDKGLPDGLGDGSGQWQLELTTDLEIGAVSFKGGVLSEVLSSAELSSDAALPSHFLRVNRLYDRQLSWRMSLGLLRDSNKRDTFGTIDTLGNSIS